MTGTVWPGWKASPSLTSSSFGCAMIENYPDEPPLIVTRGQRVGVAEVIDSRPRSPTPEELLRHASGRGSLARRPRQPGLITESGVRWKPDPRDDRLHRDSAASPVASPYWLWPLPAPGLFAHSRWLDPRGAAWGAQRLHVDDRTIGCTVDCDEPRTRASGAHLGWTTTNSPRSRRPGGRLDRVLLPEWLPDPAVTAAELLGPIETDPVVAGGCLGN